MQRFRAKPTSFGPPARHADLKHLPASPTEARPDSKMKNHFGNPFFHVPELIEKLREEPTLF
jgi:hypothetical protein